MEENVQARAWGSAGSQRHPPEGRCTSARLGIRGLEPKSPVRGKGLGTSLGLEEQELDRPGGVGRAGERGPGFIGVRSLGAQEWKAAFPAAEGPGRGGGQSPHCGDHWGLKFPERSLSGVGGRQGQARLGWGPRRAAAWREGVPESGRGRGPRTYLVPFDELTPAPQGLHHGGRLQLQRVDAGPGARHGRTRGGRATRGAPTGSDGAGAPSARSRAARLGPAASASACPPVCPGRTGGSAGPGRGGAGAGPQRRRPLPPRRPARPASAPPGGWGGDCSLSGDWGGGVAEPPALRGGWGAQWDEPGGRRGRWGPGGLWVQLEARGRGADR